MTQAGGDMVFGVVELAWLRRLGDLTGRAGVRTMVGKGISHGRVFR